VASQPGADVQPISVSDDRMFQVLEDCSPYFIRFTHHGIPEIVEYCRQLNAFSQFPDGGRGFLNMPLEPEHANRLVDMTPVSQFVNLRRDRVCLFLSKPGLYYAAHKDGLGTEFSLNYAVEVNDELCRTSWFSDADLEHYPIVSPTLRSRELKGFVRGAHAPIKTMTARQNDCILFNTEIFHEWDNTLSPNRRSILTYRGLLTERLDFFDVKRLLKL
jgi:hypothetical protein